MDLLIACLVAHGRDDWYNLPLFLVIMAGAIGARYWRFFVQWLSGIRGREWAAVSAVVEVVSVVVEKQQTDLGERIVGYLATLSYFYRNPELQMGEYRRMFGEEADAEAWTASYKGKAVMVHVDPSNPSRSVLRKEEL